MKVRKVSAVEEDADQLCVSLGGDLDAFNFRQSCFEFCSQTAHSTPPISFFSNFAFRDISFRVAFTIPRPAASGVRRKFPANRP